MSKRQRTLLFLLLLVLFLVLAPSFVLYSQGYRIDWQGGRIAQTGAFYLKAQPLRADVLIDDSLHKRTDFLFGSALTKNFFPGSYFLKVAKEGYHSWQKVLEVRAQEVTEAKNVLLFKKDVPFRTLSEKVRNFWLSPDGQRAILLKEADSGTSWSLALLSLRTGGETPLFKQGIPGQEVASIQWAENSQRFLLEKRLGLSSSFEVHDIARGQPCFENPCGLSYLGSAIQGVRFSPASSDRVLFTRTINASRVLFEASYLSRGEPAALAANVLAFAVQGTSVTWLDEQGTLWQRDLSLGSPAQVFQESVFAPSRQADYELARAGSSLLVQEDQKLFLHQENGKERKELLSPFRELVLGPDGRKAALRNEAELWVLFLQEEREQPQRKAGELVLLTRFSEPLRNLSWVNPHYLLFSVENSIRVSEIDDRDRLNMVTLSSFENPSLAWDAASGLLYVLSEGTLSVSEKVIQ